MQWCDFHTHTTASDGTERPAGNVRTAMEAGLAGVAITDHDTVAGIEAALEEGNRCGILVIPGVEISTAAGGQDIHVLGYYVDYKDPLFLERLEQLRGVRERRNEMMVQKLAELGIPISMEEVLARQSGKGESNGSIGRPHIAEVLVDKGVVSSMDEAFKRYLGKRGAAYVSPPRIHPEEAVRWIHEAGGAAVLAHPGLYGDDELVRQLVKDAGLDGIETDHADHSPEEAAKYGELAAMYGLVTTAGSDYHGYRNGAVFHAPLGSKKAPLSVAERLKEIAEKYR